MARCPDGVRETAFLPCLLPGSKASAKLVPVQAAENGHFEMPESDADPQAEAHHVSLLPADQAAALERLAEEALQALQKAHAALDQAFEEVEVTKAYFATKRRRSSA
jgi:hypothetical protein